MNCDPTLLSRCLDGELSGAERQALSGHLQDCAACASELARLRTLDGVLRAWGAQRRPVPRALERRLAASVQPQRHTGWWRARGTLQRMTPAAAGSLVAALLLLLSVHLPGMVPARPAGETAWAIQQSSIKRQAAPLLTARRSSAILGGHTATGSSRYGLNPAASPYAFTLIRRHPLLDV